MKQIIYILVIAAGLASCNGSNKVSKVNGDKSDISRKKPVCGKLHVDMNEPHLDWYEEDNSVLTKSTELLVLPKEYKVYSIDTAQLNTFFNAIANKQTVRTTVPLPKPADCQLFVVRQHNFKAAKSSATVTTAKGIANDQELALKYQQGNMEGYISWFDIDYQIITKFINGQPYFIVYTKQQLPTTAEDAKTKSPETPQMAPIHRDYVK